METHEMKMTALEKKFVNRRKKAERNITKIREQLEGVDLQNMTRALEIGCATGLASAFLAKQYRMEVYGTDFDPAEIEIARQMNKENDQLHFQIEDAARLSFADNSFDLIVSQNVFHHIPNWPQAVREIARVLKPGGYLLWLDLVFPRIIVQLFTPLVKNYGVYSQADIQTVFADNGFKMIRAERKVHGLFSRCQFLLKKS
ncbi:MAG TPA: class I SAM-dependent methyltransferase [Caldithrix sp.]|nr:class I SAM-dependent methyltransferase [Caldithrix sp.]